LREPAEIFAAVVDALRQPDIDGIDEVRERLLVDTGKCVAERMQGAGVEHRQAIEFAEGPLAKRQRVLIEEG
jgi:hypothetical protein